MTKKQYLEKILRTVLVGFALLGILSILPGIGKVNAKDAIEPNPYDLEWIKPGTEAPDFNLESVEKTMVKLSGFKHQKNVILVFYRGYW